MTNTKYILRVGYHLESGELKIEERTVKNGNIYNYVKLITNSRLDDDVIGVTLILDTYLETHTNTHSIMMYRRGNKWVMEEAKIL